MVLLGRWKSRLLIGSMYMYTHTRGQVISLLSFRISVETEEGGFEMDRQIGMGFRWSGSGAVMEFFGRKIRDGLSGD